MIDVAAAIDAEAENVNWRRIAAAGGAYVKGNWVPAVPITSTGIRATMQPAGGQISGSRNSTAGNTLMDLPEGIRQEARWLAWTRSAVILNDEIQYPAVNGPWYRVIYAWPRGTDGFVRVALGELS